MTAQPAAFGVGDGENSRKTAFSPSGVHAIGAGRSDRAGGLGALQPPMVITTTANTD
jgi:hypothetical protein